MNTIEGASRATPTRRAKTAARREITKTIGETVRPARKGTKVTNVEGAHLAKIETLQAIATPEAAAKDLRMSLIGIKTLSLEGLVLGG